MLRPMTRYSVAVILAIAATIVVSAVVLLTPPVTSRTISRGIVIVTTLPLAILFAPFIYDVLRGRDITGRRVDSFDLFAAGVSVLAWGFCLPAIVALYWPTSLCVPDVPCMNLANSIQVPLLAAGLFLKMAGYVTKVFGAKHHWWMWTILGISCLVAAIGLALGLT